MAITRAFVGSATVSTTEFSLINGSTTSADLTSTGIWQTIVDYTNLDNATVYLLKFKDRITTGGPQVTIYQNYISHAQGAAAGAAWPALHAGNGMDVSLTLQTGSATLVAWELWKTS